MASQNGIGGGAVGNAGVYNGMNGSAMPPAGHYSDMQALMSSVESLSGWLQQNREEWNQIQEGLARVERLQGRFQRDGQQLPLQNGDTEQSPTEATDSQTTLQLQNSLAAARLRINSLEETYQHQLRIQKEFEEAFESTTAQIRTYCFEQQQHIKSLHEHYTELLQQSRYETIDAQIKHQQWQAGLKRISEGVREAYKSREKEGEPWKARIAALKEENRILRAKVGWDPPIDSDEEDEEEEEGSAGDEARGRASQGSGGAVAAGIGSPGLSEQLAPMIS